jgi:hypothetical protein
MGEMAIKQFEERARDLTRQGIACTDKRMIMFIKYHLNELNHVKKSPNAQGVE